MCEHVEHSTSMMGDRVGSYGPLDGWERCPECSACHDSGWQQVFGVPNGRTCVRCDRGEQRRREANERVKAREVLRTEGVT